MSDDLDDGTTAASLADAMAARTAGLYAPADLAARVESRRRRGNRFAVAGATVGVASVVALVALVGGTLGAGNRPRPVTPAASGSAAPSAPASPSLSPENGQHPYFTVTPPPGYAFAHGITQPHRFADDTTGWLHRVSYERKEYVQITLQTVIGGGEPVTVANSTEGAEEVRIGTRTVIHVQNDTQPSGLNVYAWTEEPGLSLSVSVIGRGGVTDAEVRAFIAGLRRRA